MQQSIHYGIHWQASSPARKEAELERKEAYAFFGQVRLHENKIKRITNTLTELKACLLPGCIRYDLDKVNTSPKDKMSELYARIDELERELAEEYRLKALAVMDIDNVLMSIPEGDGKTILSDFYIARISMPKIADAMGYSLRQCWRIRNKTIEQIVEVENE